MGHPGVKQESDQGVWGNKIVLLKDSSEWVRTLGHKSSQTPHGTVEICTCPQYMAVSKWHIVPQTSDFHLVNVVKI